VVEEIIGRLPELTGTQIARLEYGLRHERRRRASAGGGKDAPHHEGAALPVTEVLEYSPYEDGYLHRHCCGSDRGDRQSWETPIAVLRKGVRQGVRATLRLCM
jgi:hypothetical protein